MDIQELVAAARKTAQRSKTCVPPMAHPKVATTTLLDWTLALDMYRHGTIEHWRFSAKLFPPGRGSTGEDWSNLGKIVATVHEATGCLVTAPGPDALIPIERAHPNATHHWMWHGDGSAVDPEVLRATTAILEQMKFQVTRGSHEAEPAQPKAPGRNDVCPCGSGRKYKKCHGGN